ncbi:uncharacterized protein PpBr36_10769 [Pyricularia pennisetigena]|uniref:uncharacterized protein n=1 Tax=Pyricularia pennisetigena TaxID=1578925 RepID=UPI00114E4AB1|nr:uncharacterized protein PpBr36_10769 [Pyricularia pennisetigena]TLS21028.1 hypothetical protein PpBr36_10769 [Pyricularia pennisetigena]
MDACKRNSHNAKANAKQARDSQPQHRPNNSRTAQHRHPAPTTQQDDPPPSAAANPPSISSPLGTIVVKSSPSPAVPTRTHRVNHPEHTTCPTCPQQGVASSIFPPQRLSLVRRPCRRGPRDHQRAPRRVVHDAAAAAVARHRRLRDDGMAVVDEHGEWARGGLQGWDQAMGRVGCELCLARRRRRWYGAGARGAVPAVVFASVGGVAVVFDGW